MQPSNQLTHGQTCAPVHHQVMLSGPTHHYDPPPPHQHGHGYSSSLHNSQHYGQPHLSPHQQPTINHGPPPSSRPVQSDSVMSGRLPPRRHVATHQHAYMPSHQTQHQTSQEKCNPSYNVSQGEFRIIELNKRLQSRPCLKGLTSPLPVHDTSDVSKWWDRFTCDFFDDNASLTVRTPGEDKPTEYTIGRALIPRFFRSYFAGGVTDLSIKLRDIRETQPHPSLVTMKCDRADIVTKNIFKHPTSNVQNYVVVHTEGHLCLEFVTNNLDILVIKSWRFHADQCHEYIDRSMITTGIAKTHLVEPITRFGLTKSTIAYLKMCMIMEPMQELMLHHRNTQMNPRACLKQLLFDRYKIKNPDENQPQPSKRRKRRAPATTGAAINKKTKASVQAVNSNGGNVIGMMHSNGVSIQNLPPTSQDVLLEGKPSMLGSDFGDENERRITRLGNNQYDSATDQGCQSKNNLSTDTNERGHDQNILSGNISSQDQSTQLNSSLPNPMAQVSSHESGGNEIQSLLDYQNINNDDNDHESGNSNELIGERDLVSATNNDNAECIINDHVSSNSNELTNKSNLVPENNNDNFEASKSDHVSGNDNELIGQNDLVPVKNINDNIDTNINDHGTINGNETTSESTLIPTNNNENGDGVSKDHAASNSHEMISGSDLVSATSNNDNGNIKCTQNNSSNSCSINNMSNGTSKQSRRRSNEKREKLCDGLMRTSDFVVAIKDLKYEPPLLWRITTGNNLLQQFEPKTINGVTLYENTNQYAGWNPEIKRDYIGVDVKVLSHNRNQILAERLQLNFQNLDDYESFHDKHFLVYLQILISTALDPKFWESIETEPKHHDYFLTSRKIIDEMIKRHKMKLSSKLKLSEAMLKNFEKYPNLIIKPIAKGGQVQTCQACNTNSSTQIVSFGNRSYDLHSYKAVKVTSELSKTDDKSDQSIVCDNCLELVRLYSEVHHMGWKFFNITLEKVNQLRNKGKPINVILDECLNDDIWINKNYAERDALWARIDQVR